jgi:hypothetical protein
MAKREATRPKPSPQRKPSPPPFLQRRSTRLIGALVAASLIAGTASVVYLTRGAREVTLGQAVEEFRSQPQATTPIAADGPAQGAAPKTSAAPAGSQAATKAAAPAAPTQKDAFAPAPEGVYTLLTDGYEETDALNGQRHTYPKETSLTARKGGCDWMNRWQPLKERWEESQFCEHPQGTEMKKYTMYHEFFRRGLTEAFDCSGGFVQKPNVKPGDSWGFTCKSEKSTATARVTVVGFENINVAGKTVRTTHYRYDIVAKGANRGKLLQERWFTDAPRTMVRWTQSADLQTDSPFGPVGYKESFRTNLKSLQPQT